jgi:hypothetical protein
MAQRYTRAADRMRLARAAELLLPAQGGEQNLPDLKVRRGATRKFARENRSLKNEWCPGEGSR